MHGNALQIWLVTNGDEEINVRWFHMISLSELRLRMSHLNYSQVVDDNVNKTHHVKTFGIIFSMSKQIFYDAWI